MSARYTKYHILNKAFTLIELLVVISIIGILATLVAANLNSARSRARDAERKSDIKNISTALRLYFNDNGVFPADNAIPWGAIWTNEDTSTVYMQTVPNDPLYKAEDSGSPVYVYSRGATGDTFTLSACLENNSDSQGKPAGTTFSFSCTTMFQVIQ
jgi:general secretion pathway protein G